MGGCGSKSNVLSHLDDSVKVMVRHDAKMLEKRGEKPGGYVPRAPHPMLDQQTEEKAKPTVEAEESSLQDKEWEEKKEQDRLTVLE